MQIKAQASGVTSILGTQIFNACNKIMIVSSATIPTAATIEIRKVSPQNGAETKIFPKGKLNIMPEICAQQLGFFTDKVYTFEICDNANLNLNGGFLIVDLESLTSGSTHEIWTLEDVLGRTKNEPIIYDRLTIPTGTKKGTYGAQECDMLVLPSLAALVEVTIYNRNGTVVRYKLAELQALQRAENDIIFWDTTSAWTATSLSLGYKDWLTLRASQAERVEIETDGTTIEFYMVKNLD